MYHVHHRLLRDNHRDNRDDPFLGQNATLLVHPLLGHTAEAKECQGY
jgi:hypothetical protein